LKQGAGAGVISLVKEEGFWLDLIYDLKKADKRAESRMLRVIQDVAIGNHEVTEKEVIEDSIKRTAPITTVTKHLPPHLNVVKNG
jgi:hypothetical protein